MSKFIEVKDMYEGLRLINTEYIREIRPHRSDPNVCSILMRNEEIYCKQGYEVVKAMLTLDPAVADIVIKGKELS